MVVGANISGEGSSIPGESLFRIYGLMSWILDRWYRMLG